MPRRSKPLAAVMLHRGRKPTLAAPVRVVLWQTREICI
jgi:hypothetical protein